MIRYFGCDICFGITAVCGEQEQLERLIFANTLWIEGYPCITSGCKGSLRILEDAEVGGLLKLAEDGIVIPRSMTTEEFYRALLGCGTPSEIDNAKDVGTVRRLLLERRIIAVTAAKSHSNKIILEALHLEGGLSIYLASSWSGPVVAKITKTGV